MVITDVGMQDILVSDTEIKPKYSGDELN